MSSQNPVERALDFLRTSRNSDGGWPYVPGKSSAPEPSSYAALALAASGRDGSLGQQCAAYLAAGPAASSAAWPQWTKSLRVLALTRLDSEPEACRRLQQELLAADSRALPAKQNESLHLDATLRGWSWIDATFSWVEPTSYAIVALKASGHASHARVQEGERLLLDRVCSDGGWNYGNKIVRDTHLEAMSSPTSLAVLALQKVPSAAEVVRRALDWLNRETTARPSALSLSLAMLAASAHGQPAAALAELLASRQLPDGSWRGQPHLTALAVLALQSADGGPNVFRV